MSIGQGNTAIAGVLDRTQVVDITSQQTITGNKTFSGITQAVTQPQNDKSVKVATTEFVKNNIQLVNSLPSTMVEGVLYCIPET